MKKRLIALLAVLSFAASQFAPAVYAVNEEQTDVFADEAADVGGLASNETEDVVTEDTSEEEQEVFADEALPEEENEEASLMETTSGTCGVDMTWTLDDEGTLTISGTGTMSNYSASSAQWGNKSNIKNVVIEYGVTNIGNYAFYGCSNIQSVSIPTSVTSIERNAFQNCSSLSSINIPGKVKNIGRNAFYGCSSLSSISIPDGVTGIGDYVFYKCTNLSSIGIPDSVTSIGYAAFTGCTGLNEVRLPKGIASIGGNAFSACTNLKDVYYEGTEEEWNKIVINDNNDPLTNASMHYSSSLSIASGTCGDNVTWTLSGSGTLTISGTGAMADYSRSDNVPWYSNRKDIKNVVIEDGVTSIGDWAFCNCSSLSSISIPNSVTSIGERVFVSNNLSSIDIPDSVTDIGKFAFAMCRNLSSISIPNGITEIKESTFMQCRGLKSVSLPDSIRTIGLGAFWECSNLSNINIPYGVTDIGKLAFWECSNLSSINIPGSVKSIGDNAFCNCSSLSSISIPSVTSIGEGVFDSCSSLSSISIPGSVKSIGNNAFSNCSSLSSVSIPNSVTSIGSGVFGNCSSLSSVSIPNSVTSIGSGAFAGCSSLSSISIPKGITTIEERTFKGCSSLSSINIPNKVTSIGNEAFSGCSSLNSISIPSNVTNIVDDAFSYCTGLTRIDVDDKNISYSSEDGILYDKNKETILLYPANKNDTSYTILSSVISIGKRAFWGCTNLSNVSIPNGVTSIGDSAFSGCTGLSNIGIPNSVTSIGNSAFSGCTGLSNIGIPNSVTSIGDSVFKGCSSLSEIKIPIGVMRIENQTFSGCSNLNSIRIPKSITDIRYDAFEECTNLIDVYYTGTEDEWGKIDIKSGNTELVNAAIHYITIEASGTCGDNVTWTLDSSGTLTISGTGAMADYSSSNNAPWYSNISDIKNVVIEDGVAEIGTGAFSNCSSLSSASIPNSVTKIGDYAFEFCGSLSSINIPAGVTSIGYSVFGNCKNLEKIEVDNENINYVSENGVLFDKNERKIIVYPVGKKDTSYAIPNSVTRIGSAAFEYCSNLSSINIPNSITSVGYAAFRYCNNLSSINIPNSVTKIEGWAFNNCSNLKTVNYFGRSTQWNSINIDSGNEQLTNATKNYLIDDDIFTSPTQSEDSYNIPNSGEYHYWEFKPEQSGTYVFETTAANVFGYLYDADVNQISAAEENNFKITFDAESGKTYYLAVSRKDSGSTGTIPVKLSRRYTIKYDANGGENAPETGYRMYGESYSVPNTIPTKNGCTFLGWSLNPSAASVDYAAGSSVNENADCTLYAVWSGMLAMPGITVTDIAGGKSVAVSGSDGAEIHYTTDGTEPTESSPVYTSPIELKTAGNYTIKAISVKSGFDNSNTASASVTVAKTAAPTASVQSGNIEKGTEVKLSGSGTIYYSVNGGAEQIYSGSMIINENTSVRAYAVENGSEKSDYAEFNYIVERITNGASDGISWRFASSGTLTISGKGNIIDYIGKNTPWSHLSNEITSVIIGEGIVSIGANAFAGLTKVKNVSIANSVNQINSGAFEGCSGIESIKLPSSMSGGIGEGAFRNCTSLKEITVPGGVSAMSKGVFEGCTNLSSITLPFIGSQVGTGNNSDTFTYVFGESLPEKLTSVEITNETNVPENAFAGLDKLVNIKINSEVNTIGNGAFENCKALKEFIVPTEVTSIGNDTFKGCEAAETISVPNKVKSIGREAFDGCKALKDINIPDGVSYLEDYTFRNCRSLTSIRIPNSVESIGVGVLEGCIGIVDMNVPFIGANANPMANESNTGYVGYFYGIEDNKDVPAALTKIEVTSREKENYIPNNAFKDCGNIVDVIIDGGRTVNDYAFVNCKNLKNLYIPKSVDKIGVNILEGCTRLETLTVPFIGKDRLDNNTNRSVLGGFFGISDGSTGGGQNTVTQYYKYDSKSGGESLEYKIPSSLKNVSVLNQTTIPTGAFMNCYSLEKVAIVSGAAMNPYAFYNCTKLKQVSLPNDLQTIGERSFAECEKLEEINIPTQAKEIGVQAFYNDRSLKNVTMPDSIEKIAEDVFNGTNIASGDAELMSDKLTITCAKPSFAYDYAVRKGINTRIVSSDELNVKKTSTTVNLLSTENYLFDVTDTHKLNGVLHVEFYNDKLEKYKEETRTADDVEYRIEVTAEDMTNFSFAKVYIADESGNAVTTEDELITKEGGAIPELPESDIKLIYQDGTVTLSGTTRIKNGTVLAEAIYDNGKFVSVKTYPVTSNDAEIKVSGGKGTKKYMLWESLSSMKKLADPVTAD